MQGAAPGPAANAGKAALVHGDQNHIGRWLRAVQPQRQVFEPQIGPGKLQGAGQPEHQRQQAQ